LKLIAFYEQAAVLLMGADRPSEAMTYKQKADQLKLRAPWYYAVKLKLLITEKQWRYIGRYWYRICSLVGSPKR
jgi:hypothetical protein